MPLLEDQLRHLDLPTIGHNLSCGLYRDFAIAITQKESKPQRLDNGEVVTPPSVLTIQIKYPVSSNIAVGGPDGSWGEPIDALVESRDAKIAVDDRRTIVWLFKGEEFIASGALKEIVDRIVDRLLQMRVIPAGNRCHECLKNIVMGPTCVEGRLGQICRQCLAQRAAILGEQTQLTPVGQAGLVLIAVPCIVTGALIWAGIWTAWYAILDLFIEPGKEVKIHVPMLVEVLVLALAAAAVAWPIAWLICQVPGRGDRIAGCVGLLCCLLSILVGEVAFWAWAARHQLGGISVMPVIRALPAIWLEDGVRTAFRALIALIAGYFVFVFSRPRKLPLMD